MRDSATPSHTREHGELIVGQFGLVDPATRYVVRPHWWPLLYIPMHAIVRGSQRVGAANWQITARELATAALTAAPVSKATRQRGFRQFGLPSVNGMLRGSIDGTVLRAATFIIPSFAPRWGALRDAWIALHAQLRTGELEACERHSHGPPHP